MMFGHERRWLPICTMRLYRRAAATSSSPSRPLWPHGFSTKTSFPAAQAMMAAGACQWSGAAITTPSTSLSSSTRRMSFAVFGARALRPVTAATPLASALSSDVADVADLRARHPCRTSSRAARPRPLVPMTASTMRSLAPWACRRVEPETPKPTVAAAAVWMNDRRETSCVLMSVLPARKGPRDRAGGPDDARLEGPGAHGSDHGGPSRTGSGR